MIENSLAYQTLLRSLKRLIPAQIFSDSFAQKICRTLLTALIFSVFLIPRVTLHLLGTPYALDLRAEDLVMALLLCAVVYLDLTRSHPVLEPTGTSSVEFYFLLFLVAAQISIFAGMAEKNLDKPLLSGLYLLKWTEYFCVFFVSRKIIRTGEDCRFYLSVFFLLGIILALYGYVEYFFHTKSYIRYYRLYERFPFYGDANHIGAFYVLWISFFTGLYTVKEDVPFRRILLPSLILVFIPFLGCQSRKSLLSLAAAFAAGFLMTRRRKRLAFVMLILTVAFVFLTPPHILMRFHHQPADNTAPALVEADGSAESLFGANTGFNSDADFYTGPDSDQIAFYLHTWRWMLRGTEKYFLWGCGMGARHRLVYESQYVLLLSETGLTGLLLFLLLCFSPLKTLGLRQKKAGLKEGTALGWRMALIGIMVHNITCVSLSVVKIAFPFWFLTALVLKIHAISSGSMTPEPLLKSNHTNF